MEEHYIQFENVIKSYGSGNAQVNALSGVSFAIDKGEFCVLLGSSGAGKTTLLNMLGGMDTLTSGRIKFDGKEISGLGKRELIEYRRHDVGFVFQFYNLIPVLNVVENMTLPVRMDGRPVNKEHLNELLEILSLKGRENHLPNQLSGGQQQRVPIGRALMNAPAVVLADEPTGNLDPKNSQEIVELLKYSNQKFNQTLIVITHDENIALQADRIIAIEDGKITRDEVIRA